MLIYATTTSERASKGQGGNEFLEISIKDEQQNEMWRFIVSPGSDSSRPFGALYEADNGVHIWSGKAKQIKGNKQKGDELYTKASGKETTVKDFLLGLE